MTDARAEAERRYPQAQPSKSRAAQNFVAARAFVEGWEARESRIKEYEVAIAAAVREMDADSHRCLFCYMRDGHVSDCPAPMLRALINPGPAESPQASGAESQPASTAAERCHAGRDGDCIWVECPQSRDGEPHATGRSCPLWLAHRDEDDEP